MEHKPDNNRKKNKRSDAHLTQRIVSGIFTAFTILIAFFVYRAISEGVGLPSSSTGIVRQDSSQMATVPTAPTTKAPTQDTTEPTESEEPTETTEPSQNTSPEELAQLYLSEMSLEEKVWQMFCLSPDQLYYEDGTMCPAGGVYFSASDMTSAETLGLEIQKMRTDAKTPLLIGTSEEGGTSSPLSALGVTDAFSSASEFAAAGDDRAVYDSALTLGEQLYEAGFNFNLAPVADTINWYPAGLEGRTFGTDVDLASKMVFNAVSGMQTSGMISCMKHFPNLGSSAPDGASDVSWRPYVSFAESDFVPFRAGIDAGAEMVLVSNMMAPDMCGGALIPSCMSANIVTNILRGELGFEGIVVSDVQTEQADVQRTVDIIGAGCDIVLLPANPQACVAAVVEAVNNGLMSEDRIDESVLRILLLKTENGIINE